MYVKVRQTTSGDLAGPSRYLHRPVVALLRFACLVLVAACYQPSPPAGAPCSETGDDCPFGQSCIRGTCRVVSGPGADGPIDQPIDAFVPDGTPADLDADGVANAADNCPNKYNPDQHDEDADGVGDPCDNCPHVANADQANVGEGSTPDGVGDACDPRPQTPGDTIEKFFSFHVAPPGTTNGGGTWTVDADSYRFGGGEGWLTLDGARDRVVVEIAGTVESNTRDLFIGISAGEANGKYYDCGYYDFGGSPTDFRSALIEYYNGNSLAQISGNQRPNRLSGAFTIRMGADSTLDRITCTTIDARGSTTSQITNATSLTPGLVSVLSEFATYRLRYLVVFGQQ